MAWGHDDFQLQPLAPRKLVGEFIFEAHESATPQEVVCGVVPGDHPNLPTLFQQAQIFDVVGLVIAEESIHVEKAIERLTQLCGVVTNGPGEYSTC